MTSTTKFVQFMHPGYEHGPDTAGHKAWNKRTHRRKFLRSRGRFRAGLSAPDVRGDLVFWGEWEAQSVVEELPRTAADAPRWIHAPRLQPLGSYAGAQNTDPFVFGTQFLYTCCKQRLHSGRPTQLRFLEPGSVILFGSHVRGAFALDTVFVVGDHLDHTTPRDIPSGIVPKAFVHTTLRPMYEMDGNYCDPQHVGWRLYRGATTSRRQHTMFSFVPARPVEDDGPQGFARPTLTLDGLITPALRQGQKITPLPVEEMRSVWHGVVDQVLDEELVLATAFETPSIEATDSDDAGVGRTRC